MKKDTRGFISIIVTIIVGVAALAGGAALFSYSNVDRFHKEVALTSETEATTTPAAVTETTASQETQPTSIARAKIPVETMDVSVTNTQPRSGSSGCDANGCWGSGGSASGSSGTYVPPVKSNDQLCKDAYGAYSVWNGVFNDKGGPACDCAAGYTFDVNVTPTKCVVQQVYQDQAPSPAQIAELKLLLAILQAQQEVNANTAAQTGTSWQYDDSDYRLWQIEQNATQMQKKIDQLKNIACPLGSNYDVVACAGIGL